MKTTRKQEETLNRLIDANPELWEPQRLAERLGVLAEHFQKKGMSRDAIAKLTDFDVIDAAYKEVFNK